MSRSPARSDLFLRTLRFRPVAMNMSLRTLSLALAGLVVAGCAKRTAPETAAPEAADATAGPAGGEADDIDALEAQLAAREDQLRALGASPPGGDGEAQVAAGATAESKPADVRDAVSKSAEDERPRANAKAAPASAPPEAQSIAPPTRCESVCEVTSSICQLRDNICGLAQRHADDPRYGRTCERATADCEFATEACHACA